MSAPATSTSVGAPVPMSGPDITEAEIDAVAAVLRSGVLSLGPRIEEFERDVAAFTGARHAIGVSSGTAGLHLAVIAAGVEPNDLVITTPFSFVASANCMLYEKGGAGIRRRRPGDGKYRPRSCRRSGARPARRGHSERSVASSLPP